MSRDEAMHELLEAPEEPAAPLEDEASSEAWRAASVDETPRDVGGLLDFASFERTFASLGGGR